MTGDALELLSLPFVQRMFVAGLLASLACGLVGTFVVVRRIVFISGGISHTTFGGIGLAYYLQDRLAWSWFEPTYGAALFAVGAAAIVASPAVRRRMREDSAIGVMWVLGMAIGVLLLDMVDRTRVQVQDPASLLFGNILLIGRTELFVMAGLVLVIALAMVLLFKDLQILAFDEEFARLSGIDVPRLNLALMVLISLTVVVLVKVVGVVLVIAMLTIPAAVAGLLARDLRTMMGLATLISVAITFAGSLLALQLDVPPGATIVLLMATVFVVALVFKSWARSRG